MFKQIENADSVYNTVFTSAYAINNYERVSAMPQRRYEKGAAVLASLSDGVQDGDDLLEIGCGTGNSTIVIANSNPNFSSYIATEPSKGFLNLATFKFRQTSLIIPEGVEVTSQVWDYIEEKRRQATPFTDRVRFQNEPAQGLSVKSESIDRVFANQVIHWLLFAPEDKKGDNGDYISQSLSEISRVLKPGGKFIFDTSGHQYNFGTTKYEGHVLKDIHPKGHPFHRSFIDFLNKSYQQESGTNEVAVNPDRISKYHNALDIHFLSEQLEAQGLSLVPLENGELYRILVMWNNQQDLSATIIDGARMSYFDFEPLKSASEDLKNAVITRAISEVKSAQGKLYEIPSAEVNIYFAAIKK